MGSSRLLGKLFCEDINISDSLVVKTLNANDITATSVTTSGLTVNGNATTTGTLNVGNSQTNGKISINGKVSIRDYGYGWLGINDGYAESWSANGVFFGKSIIRTDTAFQLGENGNKILFNTTSAKFTVPVTINNSLAANNITATNVTVNDTLKAFKYELNTIQDLGGEFCVAPIIYIQSGATVQVNKDSATTIVVSIKDTNAIKSDTIQGVRWAEKSKIKFQGKINGLSIRCNGVMKSKLNTVQNTMSLILTVDSNIANSFSTSVANATSYSDISVMLYQRVTKNSQAKDVYYPVGIRMSATGSANAAPYIDIWGSKSNSDPDTVYTVPSVRLGYLDGLKCGTYDCVGYGLYADNVYLNGTIVSNSGTIGGFNITTNALSNGAWGTDKSVLMCTGTDIAKSVGGSSAINGWCFTAGSKFGVTTNGDLYASNANISGTINAIKGTIGRFDITDTYLITGIDNKCVGFGSDQAFWAGANHGDNAPFKIGYDGSFYATKGTIGGFNISNHSLYTGEKSTIDNINDGLFIGDDGQVFFGNDDNYFKYYKNSNGKYKIDIKTDYMTFYDNGIRLGQSNGQILSLLNDNKKSQIFMGRSISKLDTTIDPSHDNVFNISISSNGLIMNGVNYEPATNSDGTMKSDDDGHVLYYMGDTLEYAGIHTELIESSSHTNTLDGKEVISFIASTRVQFGVDSIATGTNSFAGAGGTASGNESFAYGLFSKATTDNCIALGSSCEAKYLYSVAIGDSSITGSQNQTVLGHYNTVISDALFVIGNGSSDTARSNAFTVSKTGEVQATNFNGITGIENSCDSDSTTSALSAAQGKSLKTYIDNVNTNIWSSLQNSYRANYNAQYNTPVPLLINGNSLGLATAQLILEYNNSYIRFRNDGGSFYIMNGNASSWTNYITFQSTGAVAVPSTLQVPTCLYVPYATKASTTSAANAYISADGNGVLAKTSKTSSRRFKDSITTDLDEELNPEHLYDVDVVQFKYKKDYFTNTDDIRYRKNLIGLIAENVYDNYKIAADWHVDEESGKILVDAWNEQYIVPAMLKLIQEQHKEIEKLKQIIGGE